MSNNVMEERALQFATNLEAKFPKEVVIAVGAIIPNLVNGCSWGFVTDACDKNDYNGILKDLKSSQYVTVLKVKGGYIVSMALDVVLQVLRATAGDFLDAKDYEYAEKHRKESMMKLDKYLSKLKGSDMIGVFNLNDSTTITIKGERYNAFCVTYNELLMAAAKHGVKLYIQGAPRTAEQVTHVLEDVIRETPLAPSGNAMLVRLQK